MFAFADKLGEKVLESYNDPYDAYQNRNYKKELCIISDNKVIYILDTQMISVKWAVSCAKRVLHEFEEYHPDDKKPRKAIEAASNWIKDPSEKNRIICKDASDARYSNYNINIAYNAAYYTAGAVYTNSAYNAFYAAYYATNAANTSTKKLLEIKWQRKKLNQIVYKEILIAFATTQYQRLDKKLVRKIPKELLEHIASFLY